MQSVISKATLALSRAVAASAFPLLLVLIGALAAFSFSTTRTARAFQEGNDAAAYDARGLELYRQNRFEEAIVFFQQAIKLKPNYPEAHLHLGDAYLRSGAFKKAVEAYKQAVRYQPEFAMAHNNMGTAYYKLGEHKKAIGAYQEAIRLNPKEPNPYYNLGTTYLERGNKEAALEQYKIVKAIDAEVADRLFIKIYQPTANVYDSGMVRLNVIVTDSQGVPVSDLGKEDLQVSEDGMPQTISTVSKGQGPLVAVLAVDTTGSIRPRFQLVLDASKLIIQNNLPNDETALIRFISSDKIETVREFTSDQKALIGDLGTFVHRKRPVGHPRRHLSFS